MDAQEGIRPIDVRRGRICVVVIVGVVTVAILGVVAVALGALALFQKQ